MNPNKMTNNRDKFHRDPSLNVKFEKVEEGKEEVKAGVKEAISKATAKAKKVSEKIELSRVGTMLNHLESQIKDLKAQVQTGLHSVGDILETAGDKISDAGYKKIGSLVHEAGDKIEHILH
jgi:hypothetical protein